MIDESLRREGFEMVGPDLDGYAHRYERDGFGHADSKTTQIYAHYVPSAREVEPWSATSGAGTKRRLPLPAANSLRPAPEMPRGDLVAPVVSRRGEVLALEYQANELPKIT